MPSARLLAPLVAVLVLLALAPPAPAAFPGRDGLIVHEERSGTRSALVLRTPRGTVVRRLRPGGRVTHPAFSPSGQWLAFARRGNVWVGVADGTSLRPLTSDPALDSAPAWSPGGDSLVFARGPAGARDLYRTRADGAGLQRLTFRRADDFAPAWSTTDRIAFVRTTSRGDGNLWTVGPGPTAATPLTRGRGDDGAPAWSPDGGTVAFVRRVPGRTELRLVRADGAGERRLVALPQPAETPAWSPDGKRIALVMGRGAGRRLMVVRRDGRGLRALTRARPGLRAPDWQATGRDPVVAAAGDIACAPSDPAFAGGLGTPDRCRQRQTSDLLLTMDLSAVLALGDLQYEAGRPAAFAGSFGPTWGRLKTVIRPVPGNHEYRLPGASGYFDYFNGPGVASGPAGTRGAAYYSFDLGTWHLVALDSQCAQPARVSMAAACATGSPQEQWLRADLAAHPRACTLAFWHHPLFSSGIEGQAEAMRPIWRALYDSGAEVVLNGHDHAYQRFAPQTPDAVPDAARGIREFVVGTGGHSHQRAFSHHENSEARNARDFGVLKLALHPTGYDWQFVTDSGAVADAGSSPCH